MNNIISSVLVLSVIFITIPTIINRLAKLIFLYTSRIITSQGYNSIQTMESMNLPSVAFHVAIRNENPEIVIKTLSSLIKIDYPKYIVLVIDTNTSDQNLWKPIEAFCKRHQELFQFYHLEKLPGNKAGALNYALMQTPKSIDFIAIIDADTIVKPDFLNRTISYFRNKNVAIVQTPLGFLQNPTMHYFTSWIFLIYRYYLSIYMPATDRFNCAPFIGTMGIIRRSALEKAGRWNGLYLTEDMELTYRLFKQGYISHFINRHYGYSMPPTDLVNFKKQHYRWNFGNAQILRDYLILNISSNWKTELKPIRWFVYFMCPLVYINIYFIPFGLIAILIQGANLIDYSIIWTELISFIMVLVILFELIGDAVMFTILGKRENVSWKFRLENLVSWWALTLSNSLSSLEVIFRQIRPFEITEKGQKVISRKRSSRYLELIFSSLFLVASFSTLFGPSNRFTTASIVLFILSMSCAFILIIPENFNEGGR